MATLILFGVLALVAIGYAVFLAGRNRDVLPVAACVGALICAFNEPIYDVLGKIVYTQTPSAYTSYTAFGRHIPWSVVIGYVPWVGLVPYLISRMMRSGVSRARLHLIGLGLGVSVGACELINAMWLKSWEYYGDRSLRILGGGVIQMASMPIICGFLYYVIGDNTSSGWRRALLGIVTPTMALPMAFASTSWPLYVANYSNLPQPLNWAAAGLAGVLCAVAVVVVARLAHRWYAGDIALHLGGTDRPDLVTAGSELKRSLQPVQASP
jgi:hypothetical protein